MCVNRIISGTYENNIYLIILQYQHHSNINNKVKAKTLILRSFQQFSQLGICLLQICCPIDTIEQREQTEIHTKRKQIDVIEVRKCIINQCSDQAVDRFYCRLSFCYFVAVFNLVATEPRVPGDHLFICSFHRQHLWWLITLFSHTRRRSVNKDHNRKLNQCTDHEN